MVVDYQEFCPQGTSKEKRRSLNVGDVFRNAAKCLKCGDLVRSKNRHDSVTCSCCAVSVDGGSWYCKRVGNREDYQDVIEMYLEDKNG